MKRRRTFLLIFAILIMILVVGVIALWRSRGGDLSTLFQRGPETEVSETPQPEPTPEEETELVVVAVQTVPRGMAIPPDAVEVRAWPESRVPTGAASDLESVVGQVARVDIQRQSAVLESYIADVALGSGAELALAIPKGKVAFSMPVRIMSAVANAIRPGDRVDVLLTLPLIEVHQETQIKLPVVRSGEGCLSLCEETGEQIPRLVSQYSVQNVTVLDIGLWQEELPELPVPAVAPPAQEDVTAEEEPTPAVPEPPTVLRSVTELTSITLIVSPQDALVLKWALENNVSIDLVMRSAVDQDIYAQPEAVTLQYMLDRFQILVPPKLPYSFSDEPEELFSLEMYDQSRQNEPTGGE
jgi:pilus assembly protein CpaB